MSRVKLKESVSGETLESALFEAAKNLGWKVDKKPHMETDYRLASVHEEKSVRWIDYKVKGAFLPLFEITLYSENLSGQESSFSIRSTPLLEGFGTKKQVVKYLGEVSKILNS
jgi:hypothetical protein